MASEPLSLFREMYEKVPCGIGHGVTIWAADKLLGLQSKLTGDPFLFEGLKKWCFLPLYTAEFALFSALGLVETVFRAAIYFVVRAIHLCLPKMEWFDDYIYLPVVKGCTVSGMGTAATAIAIPALFSEDIAEMIIRDKKIQAFGNNHLRNINF